MSAFDDRALAPLRQIDGRALGCGAGFALAAAAGFFTHAAAPGAPAIVAVGVAGLAGVAALALAFTLDDGALPRLTQAVTAGVALIVLGAFVEPEARLRFMSFASAAFGVGLAAWLARSAGARLKFSRPLAALFAVVLACLAAYGAYIVLASHDLMIADFMTYRGIAMMVARLADAGNWPLLISAAAQSITQDYSWAPALVPGLLMAVTEPTSRAIYTFALLALYAAPAAFALAVLACDCARGAGLARDAQPAVVLGLGVAAVFVAYPAAFAVAARGMPDVGGLVLVVCALRLAERLARLIALPPGHDARVQPMTRRVALALALTLYAMFAFRRWYAFAGVGIVVMLALEVLATALRRGAGFRSSDAVAGVALGVLALLALLSPVLVDWAPNLGAHDYARTYAGYRKPWPVFLRELGDWVGLIPALAALAGAAFLWARSRDRRLLRLMLGSAAIAAALILRVQTPYIHHLDLIAPAIVVAIAASLMLLFGRAPRAALLGVAALGLITLSPLAAALNRSGLAPIAGLPRAPRADLDELRRLKDWVDARTQAHAKVCGLGSSYTFSGQLIGELWQLRPERGPSKLGVTMPDVDTVEGPPTADLKDCVIMIVGDPVQIHIDPNYQQTVIVPSREMLTGHGIGAKFRRTGEVFHLEKGVRAVVFERVSPLDDSDIAALQARWRAARAALGF